MTLGHRQRSSVPRRGERGALVVELAIVSVFLLLLAAGGYDFGQAWRSGLAVNEATRTAARVGSAGGSDRAADFNALSGAKAALASSGKLDDVVRVVVFKSTSTGGEVPATCKTGSTSACQVITGTKFRENWESLAMTDATDANGCLKVATTKNWCPTGRNNVQLTAEYYGVWIEIRHDFEFPLLGSGTDVERTTTMRLEPKV